MCALAMSSQKQWHRRRAHRFGTGSMASDRQLLHQLPHDIPRHQKGDDRSSVSWTIYDGVTNVPPTACLPTMPTSGFPAGDVAGTVKVDDSCCLALPPAPFPTKEAMTPNNCYAHPLGTAEPKGVRNYFGCDGGTPTFGELCFDDFFKTTALVNLTALTKTASSYSDCGCQSRAVGAGCFRMNDFEATVPTDKRKFFLYMKEDACMTAAEKAAVVPAVTTKGYFYPAMPCPSLTAFALNRSKDDTDTMAPLAPHVKYHHPVGSSFQETVALLAPHVRHCGPVGSTCQIP